MVVAEVVPPPSPNVRVYASTGVSLENVPPHSPAGGGGLSRHAPRQPSIMRAARSTRNGGHHHGLFNQHWGSIQLLQSYGPILLSPCPRPGKTIPASGERDEEHDATSEGARQALQPLSLQLLHLIEQLLLIGGEFLHELRLFTSRDVWWLRAGLQ